MRRRPKDYSKRIAELKREVVNLTDVIASGALRGSPALAQRLREAESELTRLLSEQATSFVGIVVPDIRRRYAAVLERLDKALMAEVDREREELRGVLSERVVLQPDKSGRFLWAEYSLGVAPLLPNAGAGAEILVAGGPLRKLYTRTHC